VIVALLLALSFTVPSVPMMSRRLETTRQSAAPKTTKAMTEEAQPASAAVARAMALNNV